LRKHWAGHPAPGLVPGNSADQTESPTSQGSLRLCEARCGARTGDRKRLEQLCRCLTRPALSGERIQINAAGQMELKLKTAWRDGTAHLVMSPLKFMQRLAALVPRPRLH